MRTSTPSRAPHVSARRWSSRRDERAPSITLSAIGLLTAKDFAALTVKNPQSDGSRRITREMIRSSVGRMIPCGWTGRVMRRRSSPPPATRLRAASWNSSPLRSRTPTPSQAYFHACRRFFDWCKHKGLDELAAIESMHPHLFDGLVVGQVVAINRAHSVHGPKHVAKRGKTPSAELLDSIKGQDSRGPARSGANRAYDLQLRSRRRGRCPARRRLLPRRQAPAGAAAREGRQAP
jgi:hypothetical protein